MTDYSKMTTEEFDGILQGIVNEQYMFILQVPGIYEVLSEHYNNEVLETWAERKRLEAEEEGEEVEG